MCLIFVFSGKILLFLFIVNVLEYLLSINMPSYYYHICSMYRPVTLIDSANSLGSATFKKGIWPPALVETFKATMRHMTETKPSQQESRMAVLFDEYCHRFFRVNGLVCQYIFRISLYVYISVMLELWGVRNTPSLPSLSCSLWPRVVVPAKGPIYELKRIKPWFMFTGGLAFKLRVDAKLWDHLIGSTFSNRHKQEEVNPQRSILTVTLFNKKNFFMTNCITLGIDYYLYINDFST